MEKFINDYCGPKYPAATIRSSFERYLQTTFASEQQFLDFVSDYKAVVMDIQIAINDEGCSLQQAVEWFNSSEAEFSYGTAEERAEEGLFALSVVVKCALHFVYKK